jgi:hypothetical protein
MITKLLIFILMVILLGASVYTVSCEQEKAAKLKILSATREQLGNAEQAGIECNLAVQKIEAEIALLRDRIVEKKVTELRECKVRFDTKINDYKVLYKAANNGREATQSHIDAMKRRLGIGGGL